MTISIRLGNPSDNPRIQDLVSKITMPGPAVLCFQRQPDFFVGAQVIGDTHVLAVAEDSERPDVLAGLTPREAKVLRMRFGIDMNTDHTLEEVGKQFDVTRERIRQIEAKALRKLRHPTRSEQLRSFLDLE